MPHRDYIRYVRLNTPVNTRNHHKNSWLSMDGTAGQLKLVILGPLGYGLSLTGSLVISVFATIFGSLYTGDISTFGPRSGLCTLNVANLGFPVASGLMCSIILLQRGWN